MSRVQAGRSDSSATKVQLMRYLKESLETASKLTLCKTPEDVAIFIGTTKSGKSTLLNSLLGNKLIGERQPKLRSISIVKADSSLGPEIGRGPTSETIYPSRWVSSEKLGGLVLWDSPGFEDNRGPIQDITTLFTYTIYSVPSSLEDEPVNVSFISEALQHKILSSDSMDMSQSTRNFIRHLTNNHNQIGLFKKATLGPIPSNANEEIVRAIQSINGVQCEILKTASPSIAHTSKIFLYEVRHELTSNKSFTELETSLKAAFKEKLNGYKHAIKHEESAEILSIKKKELIQFKMIIQEIIDANTSFHSKIETLHKIDLEFKNKIEANDLTEKSKMMEFIDSVLGLKESQIFNVSLRSIMETTKAEVNEIIIDVQLRLHEVDKKEAEEQIKKIRKEEKEKREETEKERKHFEKENNETERRFFTQIGEKFGEAVDDVCDYFVELSDKLKETFFKW